MKQKILLCIMLVLLSSVDMTWAKGKRKKTRKTQRTETVYEEIENFDFLYTDDYDGTATFIPVIGCSNVISSA